LLALHRVQVVHQHAHLHAARRRLAQGAQQQAAHGVVLELVVLHLQRALRPLGELDARVQRVHAQRHQPEARMLVGRRGGRDDLRQRGDGSAAAANSAGRSCVGGSELQAASAAIRKPASAMRRKESEAFMTMGGPMVPMILWAGGCFQYVRRPAVVSEAPCARCGA
jgi:hypothetical protein